MCTLRDSIDKARLDKGWTVMELARQADVNLGKLYNFLNGKGKLRSDTLDKLINALNLNLVGGGNSLVTKGNT